MAEAADFRGILRGGPEPWETVMKVRLVAAFVAVLLVPTPASAALTATTRNAAIDRIAAVIGDNYVYKDKAKTIAAEIRSWKSDPALARIGDEPHLASWLTDRLRAKDRHFAVQWAPPAATAQPDSGPGPQAPDPDAMAQVDRQKNYGFGLVEHLPGNVGYIRLDYFCDFDLSDSGAKAPPARKTALAALALVENSDAVIVDLRQNGGGSPAMIDLVLSAFFGPKPVLLNRFYVRHDDRTMDSWTLADFEGTRRPTVPLYVLVSGRTGSAAEEFAYDVQTQKRGLIVGERTYGAANPGAPFDAGDGFSVFVSTGAAINPITGTNWEAVGVAPDVAVPAAAALTEAHLRALKQILATAKPGSDTTAVRWALEQVGAAANPPATPPLAGYAGRYGEREIILKDGALYYSRPRGLAQKLVALAADRFGLADMPTTRLQFQRNAAGAVESVTLSDVTGGTWLFPRTP